MAEAGPSLGDLIDMEIRASGPMSMATYMALCLSHPSRGYYRKADPLGAAGDFITAPEISQTFGEMIGGWMADLYVQMGSPTSLVVFEPGPGRGTLMADALRVATRVPGFGAALQLRLFESNADLAAMQAERLAEYNPIAVSEPEDIPEGPVIVVANEFFDALPIRQFVRRGAKWFERCVGLEDGRRCFGLSPTPYDPDLLGPAFADAAEGAVAEIGLAAEKFMARLGRVVAPRGGAILAIDYGYGRTQPGETLQALARHAHADPLAEPGAADLTAHVDFETLGRAARMAGLTVAPLVEQGRFLTSLGLAERHAALARANPDKAEALAEAFARLTHPAQMGKLFKAFCAASPGLRPAGF
ncbi:class I SAM-dependent methyltransferase [Pelagibacterium montanilacus]|uniref:class I SAM-dependent methyltransferase n=1 Tax=Pelagibacterium montanilacus TaxID=2185280 RepID=UPI0019D0749D|nr:SAM-dependent methyltransferase [Pelagibacterium montanilacus]